MKNTNVFAPECKVSVYLGLHLVPPYYIVVLNKKKKKSIVASAILFSNRLSK